MEYTYLLAFLGSIVVAFAGFRGVVLSNKVSREAIAAAARRDTRSWLRSQILMVADDFFHRSELARRYALGLQEERRPISQNTQDRVLNMNSEAGAVGERLRLLVGDKLRSPVDTVCAANHHLLGCVLRTTKGEVSNADNDFREALAAFTDAVRNTLAAADLLDQPAERPTTPF